MILLLTHNPGWGNRHKPSMPVIFSTRMVSASFYGRGCPLPSHGFGHSREIIRACTAVTA